jgi:hypothetical protein
VSEQCREFQVSPTEVVAGDLISADSLDAMIDASSGGKLQALGIYQSHVRWGHDGGIAGFLGRVLQPRTPGDGCHADEPLRP